MTDFDKCKSVVDEALRGSSSVAVRSIATMLTALAMRHGAQFTINGAVQALDDIVKYAQVFKKELTKQEGTMAIYKRDSINGEGEKVEGDTILMPYRIARSITVVCSF